MDCISSAQERLGFHKGMRLDRCAPFRASLRSFDFSHFIIESGERLAHSVAVHRGSDRLSA
jgi:hypothetical protein